MIWVIGCFFLVRLLVSFPAPFPFTLFERNRAYVFRAYSEPHGCLIGGTCVSYQVYVGGAIIAAKESGKFLERFKDKVCWPRLPCARLAVTIIHCPSWQVRLNEISGISMEDLEDALGGRRIFWMGYASFCGCG